MRIAAEWMTGADDRILEFLHENSPNSPTEIANDERVRYSRPHINQRLKKLTTHSLVEDYGNGVYAITDAGEAYLEGELDAADLEPVDE